MAKPNQPKVLPDDLQDAFALQAVARGEGGPNEQIRAIKCIHELCNTDGMSFDEAGIWTDFNEGRRHIGRCVANIINGNINTIREREQTLMQRFNPLNPKNRGDKEHG
tara:strand:- start:902 stop:1225 length:324 start_codon:yes stop_codon:yes gene_type:complete